MVDIPVAVLEKPSNAESTCPHYWIIEVPRGPTSRGICKLCGKEREFDNLGPDSWRYGELSDLMVSILPNPTREDD